MDYSGAAQEVSEKHNISNEAKNQSCNILAKNVASFCPCSKNLLVAKLKKFGLISLAEDFSRQSNIYCAEWLFHAYVDQQ